MKTPEYVISATELVDIVGASAWADTMSSFASLLEDNYLDLPSDTEVVIGDQSSSIKTSDLKPPGNISPERQLNANRAVILTTATYLASALALHISNILTTHTPVFDPHQFITDEIVAISFAVTLYCAFWKDDGTG